jgi:hypothetical protein
MAPHGSIPPADNGINNRQAPVSAPNIMEDEPARRNGVNVLKEVVSYRWLPNTSNPPVDAAALIKDLVAILESNRAKTWIVQRNVTDPKAIKSVASIPTGDEINEYYSKTEMTQRGTPTGVKLHFTFVTEHDIETIKQIPDILAYIKANKLNVSEDVFEGERAIPIGCLLYIHPDPKKTNIIELEKDLQYSLNFEYTSMDYKTEREMKVKLIPKQELSRRLSLPRTMNSCAIEILTTEKDKDTIEELLYSICEDSDHYGKFLSYSNPQQNIIGAVQEHNNYLRKHRHIVLRAKREVLYLETGEGNQRMEQKVLKAKDGEGLSLFQRVDYNRTGEVTRLNYVVDNEKQVMKYVDTTFKSMYAEIARVNRKDVEPVQNIFPRYLHYDYSYDAKLRSAPAGLLPRRTRQPGPALKGTPKGQGNGNNQQPLQMPAAHGYGTPADTYGRGTQGGKPNPWYSAKKPWNDDASVGTSATMAIDTDEIKRIIEESIKEQMEKRDKELEEMKEELAKEKADTDAKIKLMQATSANLKFNVEQLQLKVDDRFDRQDVRFDRQELMLRAIQEAILKSAANNTPMTSAEQAENPTTAAADAAASTEPAEMETEPVPPTPEMNRKPAATRTEEQGQEQQLEQQIDANQEAASTELQAADDVSNANNQVAPPPQQTTTDPTPTPTAAASTEPTPPPTEQAVDSSGQPESKKNSPLFSMGTSGPKVAIKAPPKDRRFDRANAQIRKQKQTPAPTPLDEVIAKYNAEHSSPVVKLVRLKNHNDNKTPNGRDRDQSDPVRRKKSESFATPLKQTTLFTEDKFPEKDQWDDDEMEDTNEAGASANNDNNDAGPAQR